MFTILNIYMFNKLMRFFLNDIFSEKMRNLSNSSGFVILYISTYNYDYAHSFIGENFRSCAILVNYIYITILVNYIIFMATHTQMVHLRRYFDADASLPIFLLHF